MGRAVMKPVSPAFAQMIRQMQTQLTKQTGRKVTFVQITDFIALTPPPQIRLEVKPKKPFRIIE